MKMKLTNKRGAMIACSALMAVALSGGIAGLTHGVNVSAAEGDATSTPKIFYYVDAGNLATTQGGTTKTSGHQSNGFGAAIRNNFMLAYGLQFGDENGNGLYNSLTDWELYYRTSGVDTYDLTQLTPDPTTNKEWGAYVEGESKAYAWSYWRYATTASTAPGYDTVRYVNENDNLEGSTGLIYKFEVDDDTTELAISIGTRGSNQISWVPNEAPNGVVNINGAETAESTAENPILKHEPIPAYEDRDEQYDFSAYGVEENGKYYVTLTFGGNSKLTYFNWIMISEKGYELPVAYTFPSHVESNATTVTVKPSDGSADVTATITDESKAALAAAYPLSEVEITVDVGNGKTASSKVTVLPANMKYFLNIGSDHDVPYTVRDGQYDSTKGYGYISEQGTVGWADASFDESNRYDVTDMTYRFDVEEGSYAVLVGTFTWWGNIRTATLTANDGPAVSLTNSSSENGTKDNAICYGDVTSASGGHLDVRFVCPEKAFMTYILVYKHEHGTMNKTDAVASTCKDHGTIEYYTCSVCGQKYNDANATTLITDTEAPLADHTYGELVAGTAATCEAAGTKAHYTCSVCEKNFDEEKNELDSLESAKLAHGGTKTEAVAATCEHAGNVAYWTCENGCGKKYNDNEGVIGETVLEDDDIVTEKAAHTLGELVAETPATCTVNGTKAHYTCSVCNKNFSDAEGAQELTDLVILAGHKYGEDIEWHWTDDLTACTYSATCTVCGAEATAQPATVTNAVTTDPTCTEKGVKTYTATAGDKSTTKTEEIAALGHDYDYENITWNWNGYECTSATVACKHDAAHTDTLTVTVTSEVTTEATTEADGVRTYTAKVTVGDKTYTVTKTEKIDKLTDGGKTPATNDKKGLKPGAIAGIVIAVVVVVVAAVVGVVLFKRKKN